MKTKVQMSEETQLEDHLLDASVDQQFQIRVDAHGRMNEPMRRVRPTTSCITDPLWYIPPKPSQTSAMGE